MKKLFSIWNVAVLTHVFTFVKIHQTVVLKSLQFTVWKLYFNNITLKIKLITYWMRRRMANLSERNYIFLGTKGKRGGDFDRNDLAWGPGTTSHSFSSGIALTILSTRMEVFAFEKFTMCYAAHWESQKILSKTVWLKP